MKRRKLIRHLEAHGCPLKREGGSHSIYWNPNTGRREPVPRHSGIPDLSSDYYKTFTPSAHTF